MQAAWRAAAALISLSGDFVRTVFLLRDPGACGFGAKAGASGFVELKNLGLSCNHSCPSPDTDEGGLCHYRRRATFRFQPGRSTTR